jgi:hypothetical protein
VDVGYLSAVKTAFENTREVADTLGAARVQLRLLLDKPKKTVEEIYQLEKLANTVQILTIAIIQLATFEQAYLAATAKTWSPYGKG